MSPTLIDRAIHRATTSQAGLEATCGLESGFSGLVLDSETVPPGFGLDLDFQLAGLTMMR